MLLKMDVGFHSSEFANSIRLSRKLCAVLADDGIRFDNIANEGRNLCNAVDDVEAKASGQTLTDAQLAGLERTARESCWVLGDLFKALERYEELDTNNINALHTRLVDAVSQWRAYRTRLGHDGIATAIHEMPVSESRNEAPAHYDQAIESIRHLNPHSRDLAERALRWIASVQRPLRAPELQVALAINEGDRLVEENVPPIQDIMKACAGLVTLDKESSIICLRHGTTQEHLHKAFGHCIAKSNLMIARVCIAILSSDWSGALIDYAAKFWSYHLRHSLDAQRHDWVINFLGSELIMRALSREDLYYTTGQATALHLAAYFGLDVAVETLIQRSYDPNAPAGRGWTPIFYAVKGSHCSTIRVLIRCGAKIEARCSDNFNCWAIQEAVQRGVYDTAKLLLDLEMQLDPGVETWPYRDAKSIALQSAVVLNDAEMVSLLLSYGASIDYVDNGTTALIWAACQESTAMTRLLIGHGANINARGRDGETALMHTFSLSSDRMDIKQAEVLLESKAETEACDSCGRTVLARAAMTGRNDMVRLLIKHGAVVDGDPTGWTPLYLAVHDGHVAVVELLLEAGADPDVTTVMQQVSALALAKELVKSHCLEQKWAGILAMLQAHRRQLGWKDWLTAYFQ